MEYTCPKKPSNSRNQPNLPIQGASLLATTVGFMFSLWGHAYPIIVPDPSFEIPKNALSPIQNAAVLSLLSFDVTRSSRVEVA
jgi:hypothetical protein